MDDDELVAFVRALLDGMADREVMHDGYAEGCPADTGRHGGVCDCGAAEVNAERRATVAALRALVGLHEPCEFVLIEIDGGGDPDELCPADEVPLHNRVMDEVGKLCRECQRSTPCETLRHIAAIGRLLPDGTQHPEWREEWAPDA